ncbi:MAG: transglycosylase SLT domain-containing protein [Deltaproteobacteria bacterium]|nr:transglycosylase SLT domain-containing protein [Deltaproteobacteria bacterium]
MSIPSRKTTPAPSSSFNSALSRSIAPEGQNLPEERVGHSGREQNLAIAQGRRASASENKTPNQQRSVLNEEKQPRPTFQYVPPPRTLTAPKGNGVSFATTPKIISAKKSDPAQINTSQTNTAQTAAATPAPVASTPAQPVRKQTVPSPVASTRPAPVRGAESAAAARPTSQQQKASTPSKTTAAPAPRAAQPSKKTAPARREDKAIAPSLLRTTFEVSRVLFVPTAAVLIACASLVFFTGREWRSESSKLALSTIEAEESGLNSEEVGSTTTPKTEQSMLSARLSDALALFSRDRNTELALKQMRPPVDAHLEDMKSKIKFISGLVAMHRPTIANCGDVAKAIVEIAAREKVDPFYVAAIISIESRFANTAVSPVGARGLMQLMPATAEFVAGKGRLRNQTALSDTVTNISLGVRYIRQLEARYRGNKSLALAAYNWGPGNVDRVKKGQASIPGSVKNYAKTVLDRSTNWAAHYNKAKESAAKLEMLALSE